MRSILFLSFFILNTSLADVGKVLKIVGGNDAYLIREQSKIPLSPDLQLELGDDIFSQDSLPVIFIFPGTQLSLSKNTQIKLTKHLIEENADAVTKSTSVVDFVKGILRATISREEGEEVEQKIQAEGVAFGVRGTEFEVSQEGSEEIDLDVFEGSVEVSSPHVHTFVPEIVKANEGFKYNKKKRLFTRRKFSPKFKNHPGFENKKQLRAQWKELRKKRPTRLEKRNLKLNKVRTRKRSRDN